MARLDELVGEHPSIAAVRDGVCRVLERTGVGGALPPILILGETGTGKGVLASAIHRAGPRASGPFVAINCAAIPETLLEAELFGYERGAFTDARQAKPGLFQAAHRGTLFLDEIAELPELLQPKLLKAIEEREVRRLGSIRSEPVDVSIIAATSVALPAAGRRFSEALYHRLSVLTFRLPPLRERGRDIVRLAETFLVKACADYRLPPKGLTPDAQAALMGHAWPGNVRELGNVIERAALLTDGPAIGSTQLGLPPETARVGEAVAAADAADQTRLLDALDRTGWNVTHAAEHLGLSRNVVRYRIEKYDLRPGAGHRRRRRRSSPAVEAGAPAVPPSAARVGSSAPTVAVSRWERRLVALLGVTVHELEAKDSPIELGRDSDTVVQKAESFGGRIEEAGPLRIVAAFGVEPAEDAPRRAALAAMAVRNALARVPLSQSRRAAAITIAIHADQCPVGQVGGAAHMDGDVRRRMTMALEELGAHAERDTIVVSTAARSLLARRFEFDDARLLGYQPHLFGVAGRPGPFVGREREIGMLRARWQEALEGRGQIVAVVGEPGIGKSRLLFEFRRRLDHERLAYFEGRGESYGASVSYLPVIDLLKRYFGLDERDDPATIADKVWAQILALDETLASDVAPLLALLDAPVSDPRWPRIDPPQRRQRTLDALRRLVLRASQAQPALVVIEDLHWIDAETQAFLDVLMASLPTSRLLVLVSYRPEYRHRVASRTSYTQVHLDPLGPASAEDLVRGLIGDDVALRPLTRLLLEWTEGNPFFLEETVRALVETAALAGERGAYRLTRPVERLKTPATVQAILAARIDRLGPEAKRLLQAAAVIGKDVSMPLLLAIAEAPEHEVRAELTRLQAAEFLYETRLFPDLEYTFKHALTHEVAYQGLLHDRQRALHVRITEAIERLATERVAEQAERLAHHALRGELWDKAVAYLRQAGLRATARAANYEAIAHLEQALGALRRLPETRETMELTIDIHIDLRNALNQLGDWARMGDHLHEAEVLARKLGDQHRLGRIATFLVVQCLNSGDYDEAVRFGQEALGIARTLGDRPIEVVAASFLGMTHLARGEFSEAATFLKRNAALKGDLRYERFGTPAIQSALSGARLAGVLSQLGRFDEAIGHAEAAVQIAEAADHPFTLHFGLFGLGLAHLRRGDLPRATRVLERGLDLCRTSQIVAWTPLAAAALGAAYALAGRADEALPLVGGAVEEFRSRQRHNWPGLILLCAGTTHLLAGRIDEAASDAREALVLTRRLGARGSEAEALCLAGDIASRGDVEDAEGRYREGLALADDLSMRPLVAHCHRGLGTLQARMGRSQQAREHLAVATQMYREMDMHFWLEQADAAMAALA